MRFHQFLFLQLLALCCAASSHAQPWELPAAVEVDSARFVTAATRSSAGVYLDRPCAIFFECYDLATGHRIHDSLVMPGDRSLWHTRLCPWYGAVFCDSSTHEIAFTAKGYGTVIVRGLRPRTDSLTALVIGFGQGNDTAKYSVLDAAAPVHEGQRGIDFFTGGETKGVMKDLKTGKPIRGARITYGNFGSTTTSDESGQFSIHSREFGKILPISVVVAGYETISFSIRRMFLDQQQKLEIHLDPRPSFVSRFLGRDTAEFLVVLTRHGWGMELREPAYRIDSHRMKSGQALGMVRETLVLTVARQDDSGLMVTYDDFRFRACGHAAVDPMPPPVSISRGKPIVPWGESPNPLPVRWLPVDFISRTVCGGTTYSLFYIGRLVR